MYVKVGMQARITRVFVVGSILGDCMQSFFLSIAPATIWYFEVEPKIFLNSKHSFGVSFGL